jgi:uncharacterized protein YuzE
VTFKYDKKADALEITIREDGIVARTTQLDEGTLVDLDEHGAVLTIELIRPARSWPIADVLALPGIDEGDAEILHALWGAEGMQYPFTGQTESAAEATTAALLVPA